MLFRSLPPSKWTVWKKLRSPQRLIPIELLCVVAMYSPVGERVIDVGALEKAIQSTQVAVGISQTRIVLSRLDVKRRRALGLNDISVIGAEWRGTEDCCIGTARDDDGVGAEGKPSRRTTRSASQSNTIIEQSSSAMAARSESRTCRSLEAGLGR